MIGLGGVERRSLMKKGREVPLSVTFSRSSRIHGTSHPYQDSVTRCHTSLFQSFSVGLANCGKLPYFLYF